MLHSRTPAPWETDLTGRSEAHGTRAFREKLPSSKWPITDHKSLRKYAGPKEKSSPMSISLPISAENFTILEALPDSQIVLIHRATRLRSDWRASCWTPDPLGSSIQVSGTPAACASGAFDQRW